MNDPQTACGDDLRCVVADDVRAIRRQVSTWITELGFTAFLTPCGETALEAIRVQVPHLVISDIDMPHRNGLQLAQEVRRDLNINISAVPIVIVSSLEDSKIHHAVAGIDECSFLRKPLSKSSFVQCISNILVGDSPTNQTSGKPYQFSRRFREILSEID